jgi:general secretion pathway protein H
MTHPVAKSRHFSGFTLLELLVVIAIMGLIGGLAFPAIDRAMKAQAFRIATLQIETAVRRAHAQAIRGHRTVTLPPFTVGDSRTTIVMARGPFSSDLAIQQTNALRFYSDGTSSGGAIQIASGKRSFRIVVNAETGIVKAGLF